MGKHELVIVPDVHGRMFWKDALPYINDGTPVIFLGDYLDPYDFEGITKEQAFSNFKEIIDATKDKFNVHLLIGNHDCTYIWPEANICECRTDYYNLPEIHTLFRKNLRMFRLYWSWNNFLFTHAGVHPSWLKTLVQKEDLLRTLEHLDVSIIANNVDALKSLADVSGMRGGFSLAGSCVWADIHEFNWPTEPILGYTQIVGHTQQLKREPIDGGFKWVGGSPVRMNNVLCLDCHQCFYIDAEGDIRYLKDDILVN